MFIGCAAIRKRDNVAAKLCWHGLCLIVLTRYSFLISSRAPVFEEGVRN